MPQANRPISENLILAAPDGPVIITGAASGLGLSTAMLFAEAGAKVFATDIRNVDLGDQSGDVTLSSGDLTSEDYVRSLIESASEDEPLSSLVHCAGIFDGPELEVDLAYWESVIKANLTSGFLLLKYAIPQMLKRGHGSIVLIGSVSGINGGYLAGPGYAASKAGVHGLVKWAAKRYAAQGLRVNGIAPGTIRTPMSEAAQLPPSLTPMGHRGEPIDISRTALYLAGPCGNYITGTIFVVDGGMTL